MSSRNNTRAALASATALQGATVSPDAPIVAPVVSTDASPLPADATKTNVALPSKRALATYAAGIAAADAGEDMTAAGRGMVSAAIVDYCVNSLKWKPANAIRIGQDDNELAKFHASCVAVFYGKRPPTIADRKASISVQHLTRETYKDFTRQQYHITEAADLAICLIADGCTMRDYDEKLSMWNLRGELYCEDGCKPVDGKARYTMERCRAKADYIPCKVGNTDASMPRDRSHYVEQASLRNAILSKTIAKVKKREEKEAAKRAPHHNNASQPAGARPNSPEVGATVAAAVGVAPSAPALVTPGTNPQPTPGYNAGAVTNGPGAVTGNTTTAPMDSNTKEDFANNIIAMRHSMLAVCEAPNVVTIKPDRIRRIGPTTLQGDGFKAWMDIVAMVHLWETAMGATTAPVVSAPTTPIVSTEPTKIGDVVLSTPTKATKTNQAAA